MNRWTPEQDLRLAALYPRNTHAEIAAAMNLSTGQVRSRITTLGLAAKVRPWSDAEIAELRKFYAEAPSVKLMNLARLAKRLRRDKANVCRKARALGLTDKNRLRVIQLSLTEGPMFSTPEEKAAAISKRMREYFATHGHPRGSLGMRHSESTKQLIAEQSKKRWQDMTEDQKGDHILKNIKARRASGKPIPNPRGSWKAAWRDVGPQRHFFRSRWEANYARYLEWLRTIGQIKQWEHEPHTFWFEGIKRGCVSYLPDFRVTNPDGSVQWHEVKGWMDARSKTVLSRMEKYFPNEVMVVIGEKQYREIDRKVSSLIPGWER